MKPEMDHERARRGEARLSEPEFRRRGGPFIEPLGRCRVAVAPEVTREVTPEVFPPARRKGSRRAQTAQPGPTRGAGKGDEKGTKGT